MPIMNARKTKRKMTMNLKMSLTVLPREICSGPKLSLAGRMYAIREKLSTTATAYSPSDTSWGSEGSQVVKRQLKEARKIASIPKSRKFHGSTRYSPGPWLQISFTSAQIIPAGDTGHVTGRSRLSNPSGDLASSPHPRPRR
ncbi:hypothetical protein EYF80_026323 [Liparis tanakae]|uniref:Uncharacterized protein n=1 Tax=Liparis tanakae TaxID=230148 RepID=A0A4Z2HEQ8_9TELE|nr:hypothetical protein EYF80_026323 [Liparis tanakae]